ncbi:hypothetical protein J5W01_00535 [Akkermansia muciniphila]|uniref:hypothetical protein n=1 Tax=Akkermansia sp. TaxID=1872421 RepID=UPI001C03707D|nr:hypothetical protein [Candidatus Akkermansia timonensis]MBT9561443.1 hypothetical protein [Candidatus Akkermansia timonensis]MBT9599704.1 hypothetical protein [Akkermansia muciniphila]DAI93481.1 MAG TPA: hypothetical protein [Caudoviricetes sp.]
MSSLEVQIDVKGMDIAIKKAKTNIERFGALYTTLLSYNTASGMCFNATLPLGKNRKSKVSGRKSGEGSISRDVSRAGRGVGTFINQLKQRDIERGRQVAGILALSTAKTKDDRANAARRAEKVATEVLGQVVRFYQSYSPEFHTSARKNGRVESFAGNVVINKKSTESYKKKVFNHIGKAKSGWLINTSYGWAARAPQWIARHGQNGTIKKLPDGSIEIENKLPYASDAMIKALEPFVITKAIQATNLKLHYEWQRRNKA